MKEFYAIGLMSGTSLDGLDIVYARFSHSKTWSFEILNSQTIAYSEAWKQKLSTAITLSAEDLLSLNTEYGFYLAEKCQEFISYFQLSKVDCIASHGHTVFHQPKRGFTLQIGDGRAIKTQLKLPVVYDFRSQDVILGGNGAPLVPIGDELLFSEHDACLNLGGFSNVSFRQGEQRKAFDICPVNIVLNFYCEKLGKNFDDKGDIARQTLFDEKLVQKLSALDFYQEQGPKSLGIEWVQRYIFPELNHLTPQQAIASFTQHVAREIAKICNQYRFKDVLVTGGGAYNQFLIESINQLTNTKLVIPTPAVIEYKEALVFALMGVLRMMGEDNVLASATGAKEDHCSGIWI
ncbi:anhydro-N-acetylmuramic acid kinase [Elizabethkingia sp. JS20170427COW]|uniref:anhydro-N-acetylmuramic acid kinase n=1 Tax=Elizabethkingia sp. JS20170427COW TaxID=2583851 RepID=UPI001110DBA0|nr:anhydro-N-acetylmuramic acid kinase [Elizabethkingia sp. JS20170427COW]QCX54115.1 anhydro-N-acetylmuramic acid kinase [Elizabethkingia sp. JS20170427COW]